jgi:hemerythrin
MTNHRQKPAIELDILIGEHSQIHRRYADLDDAILQGFGSPRIIESARELVRAMLLHFIHEEQFLGALAFSSQEAQRDAGKKTMAEVLRIERGLIKDDVHSALRMRGLCKRWMYEHMNAEGEESEFTVMAASNEASRIPVEVLQRSGVERR